MHISFTATATLAVCSLALSGCGVGGGSPVAEAPLACDDSIKTSFVPDSQTSVVLVKEFKKGDALLLSGTATATTPLAANDVCLVKLNVGPGNPGPADAPSTSPGIGIEIWLPAASNWNQRVHTVGGGGWAGVVANSPTSIANARAAAIAGTEGAVSSYTDTGHAGNSGSFAMNPDGTFNDVLWKDFSLRSIQEQAVKTKALATAYYGSAPKYSYFEGGSQGGRQGLSLAQNFPSEYDGIIANEPAINWTEFTMAGMYPQIVFQRDLGGVGLTTEQQDLMSNAAINACDVVGGQHMGYVMDPAACTYDPSVDPNVLCTSSGGNNSTSACVTPAQATAMNKIWYGITADGSVPSPSADNGWSLAGGVHRWYGPTRGTSTYFAQYAPLGVDGPSSPSGAFFLAADQLALTLQDPTMATARFVNATGNGSDQWRTLTYADFNNAFDRGLALQPELSNIHANNPDLSAFKARGGKLLTAHGLNDELIYPGGTVNYYNKAATAAGGLAALQHFYRLYLVPGMGHAGPNGTSNPNAAPPVFSNEVFYSVLVDWVEKGIVPDRLDISTPATASVQRSQPICVYPKKATYTSGDVNVAASYTCS